MKPELEKMLGEALGDEALDINNRFIDWNKNHWEVDGLAFETIEGALGYLCGLRVEKEATANEFIDSLTCNWAKYGEVSVDPFYGGVMNLSGSIVNLGSVMKFSIRTKKYWTNYGSASVTAYKEFDTEREAFQYVEDLMLVKLIIDLKRLEIQEMLNEVTKDFPFRIGRVEVNNQ